MGRAQESPAFPSPPCNAGCAPLNASEPIPSWYQHPEKLSASDGAMVFSQELGNAPKGQDVLKIELVQLGKTIDCIIGQIWADTVHVDAMVGLYIRASIDPEP